VLASRASGRAGADVASARARAELSVGLPPNRDSSSTRARPVSCQLGLRASGVRSASSWPCRSLGDCLAGPIRLHCRGAGSAFGGSAGTAKWNARSVNVLPPRSGRSEVGVTSRTVSCHCGSCVGSLTKAKTSSAGRSIMIWRVLRGT
jgi:hypothetical protein